MASKQVGRSGGRIRGNFRGGSTFRGFGRGNGTLAQTQPPRAPFPAAGSYGGIERVEGRMSLLGTTPSTTPNLGIRRENFDDRQSYVPYERQSTLRDDTPMFMDKRYDDIRIPDRSREVDERRIQDRSREVDDRRIQDRSRDGDDRNRTVSNSRRRSRSRSPPQDYYRRRETESRCTYGHSLRRSRSRSRSPYGRGGDSPRTRQSYSSSPAYRRELDVHEKPFENVRNLASDRAGHQVPVGLPNIPEKRQQIAVDKKDNTDFSKSYKDQITQESQKTFDRSLTSPRVQEVAPDSVNRYQKFDMFEDRNDGDLNFSDRFKTTSANQTIGQRHELDILDKPYFSDKSIRDSYGRISSSFDEKPSQDFKPSSSSWSHSPPSKASNQLPEAKSTVKSILKKNTSDIQPEEEFNSRSSGSSSIPGLSFKVPRTTRRSSIPGLGDSAGDEDEEAFLYGGNLKSSSYGGNEPMVQKTDDIGSISRSRFLPMDLDDPDREKKLETRYKDFKNFPILRDSKKDSLYSSGKTSPTFQRDLSPISKRRQDSLTRELSPFHSRRNDARFNEELSPNRDDFVSMRGLREERLSSFESDISGEREVRNKLSLSKNSDQDETAALRQSGRNLDDVLKSIGIEMVRQLQKRSEVGKNSPFEDDAAEAAKLHGIKSDLQTSSFFESSQSTKTHVENLLGLIRQETQPSWQTQYNEQSGTDNSAVGYSANQPYAGYTAQQQTYPPQTDYPTNQEYPGVAAQDPSNYYAYNSTQYVNDTDKNYSQEPQQVQTNRQNLNTIPLQQPVEAQSLNLRVIPTAAEEPKKNDPPTPAAVIPKTEPVKKVVTLTASDRQSLAHQRETQLRRLDVMEKEKDRLRKQQGELIRKTQKQKDGRQDPLLTENYKLQNEISRQISSIKRVIDELTGQLRASITMESGNKGRFNEKQRQQVVPEEEKKPVEVKIKKEDEPEKDYDYFDAGSHWCKQCNEVFPNLRSLFQHLQGKRHKQQMDPHDRPWQPEALSKPSLVKPARKGLSSAVKGVQFLMPVAGYYCSLCSKFMGDANGAELHVKSREHNFQYIKYVLENPHYERRWNLDKAAGIAVKTKQMKQKVEEDARAQKAKRRKLEMEAEKKNRELIKVEAARDKKVKELDHEAASTNTSSRKPDKYQSKEIKLTLKVERERRRREQASRDAKSKQETKTRQEAGFGRITWRKDVPDSKRSDGKKVEAGEKGNAENGTISVQMAKAAAIQAAKESAATTNWMLGTDTGAGAAVIPQVSYDANQWWAMHTPVWPSQMMQMPATMMQMTSSALAPVTYPTVAYPSMKIPNPLPDTVMDKSTIDLFMAEPLPPGTEISPFVAHQQTPVIPFSPDLPQNDGNVPSKADIANASTGKFDPKDQVVLVDKCEEKTNTALLETETVPPTSSVVEEEKIAKESGASEISRVINENCDSRMSIEMEIDSNDSLLAEPILIITEKLVTTNEQNESVEGGLTLAGKREDELVQSQTESSPLKENENESRMAESASFSEADGDGEMPMLKIEAVFSLSGTNEDMEQLAAEAKQ